MVPPRLASRIDAVTVFVSGALVTRYADLATVEGRPQQVRITGLPLCLEDASLRVSISGGVAIAGDVQVALDVPPIDTTLPPPQDAERLAARRAVAEAQVRVEVLDEQLERLERLDILDRPAPQRGTPPSASPTAARLMLVEFAVSQAERLSTNRAAARAALREAEERSAELEARAAAASNARQARPDELRKSALVTLRWQGDMAATGTITVEYRVPGARWMPTYVVRFDDSMTKATVHLRAALAQASGEDWANVRLTLSTASSLAWHALPELASRRIGRRQHRPAVIGWRSAPDGAEGLYADYDRARQHVTIEFDRMVGGQLEAIEDDDDSRVEERRPAKAQADRAKKSAPPAPAGMAAPPPAPRAAAASVSIMMDEVAAPEPMAKERRSRRMMAKLDDDMAFGSDGGGAPGSAHAEPEPPSELDPSAWLAFGMLRLGGPDDEHRGRLRHAKASDGYLALLTEQRITVTSSVLAVLRDADGRAQAPQQLPAPTAHAQTPSSGRFAHVYPATLPVSVASDGAWHVLPVIEHVAAVDMGHVCVPREAREVFRIARFANPVAAPLPAGPVDCYAGERYLMTVPLAGVDVGGVVTLGLGVEPGITVARNTSVSERSGGMLGGTLNVDHRIRICVANKLQRAVAIEVRERLPVSRNRDCVVKTGEVKPPWNDFAQPNAPIVGGHHWQITIAPAAEVELAADYSVAFPAKHEITGGNRREGA